MKKAHFSIFSTTNKLEAWTLPWPHKETDENLHAKLWGFIFGDASSFLVLAISATSLPPYMGWIT
jgi:hypothetical protein